MTVVVYLCSTVPLLLMVCGVAAVGSVLVMLLAVAARPPTRRRRLAARAAWRAIPPSG